MIKNVIFDIGNVLVDFRYHEYMKELGFCQQAIRAIEERIVENELWDKLDLGVEKEEAIIAQMKNAVPEYKKEAQLFFDNLTDIVETYSYTIPWISSLKKEGYKIYLLTNYPETMFKEHDARKFGFTHLVDGVVVSSIVKMSKPDPNIYIYMLKKYNLKAEESIFIDDRIKNVEAAEKLGIHTILFSDYKEANNRIKEEIKKNEKK